ncbi:hypothetical protein [Bradyrhizobium sp. CCBAU 25338]|uniref:hypothetical protein n=1 Tax=unclassified Bradyrhizobium TaxID=2631580 RepID=UPI003FA4734E|nr:hypothetical protein [Bradyrhizobium sp. CCBAU 45389]MDA9528455.1 hypothetical protein [Bradyrhizobium sp. CCBAU 25338]
MADYLIGIAGYRRIEGMSCAKTSSKSIIRSNRSCRLSCLGWRQATWLFAQERDRVGAEPTANRIDGGGFGRRPSALASNVLGQDLLIDDGRLCVRVKTLLRDSLEAEVIVGGKIFKP